MKADLDNIYQAVKKEWGFDFLHNSRKLPLVKARIQFHKLAKELLGISFYHIGLYSNNRTHATILHSINAFEGFINEPIFLKKYTNAKERLDPIYNSKYDKKTSTIEKLLTHLEYQNNILKQKNSLLIKRSTSKEILIPEINELTTEELSELINYKIRPHIALLKTRKYEFNSSSARELET